MKAKPTLWLAIVSLVFAAAENGDAAQITFSTGDISFVTPATVFDGTAVAQINLPQFPESLGILKSVRWSMQSSHQVEAAAISTGGIFLPGEYLDAKIWTAGWQVQYSVPGLGIVQDQGMLTELDLEQPIAPFFTPTRLTEVISRPINVSFEGSLPALGIYQGNGVVPAQSQPSR